MESNDEIVVLKQFDDTIVANIAKTKLDAYGIPCFLTGENMANLYPGQFVLAFRIRLHVFKKDIEEATQLLSEHLKIISSDLICPNCKSNMVQRDYPKKFKFRPLAFLGILFVMNFSALEKVNHCLNCDCEF
jgi:hypothetical protein